MSTYGAVIPGFDFIISLSRQGTISGEAGSDQQTPNIASVIQEIVNHSDWFEGNSLVIIITGTGERVAESYEGTSSGAPLLHVEYHSP